MKLDRIFHLKPSQRKIEIKNIFLDHQKVFYQN